MTYLSETNKKISSNINDKLKKKNALASSLFGAQPE
jgi:hypothetical protein